MKPCGHLAEAAIFYTNVSQLSDSHPKASDLVNRTVNDPAETADFHKQQNCRGAKKRRWFSSRKKPAIAFSSAWPNHATHLVRWTRGVRGRWLPVIYSPFGKGRSRGFDCAVGRFSLSQSGCPVGRWSRVSAENLPWPLFSKEG